jgi:hypothetical protein
LLFSWVLAKESETRQLLAIDLHHLIEHIEWPHTHRLALMFIKWDIDNQPFPGFAMLGGADDKISLAFIMLINSRLHYFLPLFPQWSFVTENFTPFKMETEREKYYHSLMTNSTKASPTISLDDLQKIAGQTAVHASVILAQRDPKNHKMDIRSALLHRLWLRICGKINLKAGGYPNRPDDSTYEQVFVDKIKEVTDRYLETGLTNEQYLIFITDYLNNALRESNKA